MTRGLLALSVVAVFAPLAHGDPTVSPTSGTGMSQTFTLTYNGPQMTYFLSFRSNDARAAALRGATTRKPPPLRSTSQKCSFAAESAPRKGRVEVVDGFRASCQSRGERQ